MNEQPAIMEQRQLVINTQPTRFTFPTDRYMPGNRSVDASRVSTATNTPRISVERKESPRGESNPTTARMNEVRLQEQSGATNKVATTMKAEITPPNEHTSVVPSVVQAIFGGAIYGYNTGIIAGLSGPLIDRLFFPDSTNSFRASMTGILVSSILIGGFIGTMLSLPLTNRFGRKISFIVCGSICVAACVGLAFIDSFVGVVLLRTLLGVSVGMTTTVCPLYSAECSPISKRGAVGTVYQVRERNLTVQFTWRVIS